MPDGVNYVVEGKFIETSLKPFMFRQRWLDFGKTVQLSTSDCNQLWFGDVDSKLSQCNMINVINPFCRDKQGSENHVEPE